MHCSVFVPSVGGTQTYIVFKHQISAVGCRSQGKMVFLGFKICFKLCYFFLCFSFELLLDESNYYYCYYMPYFRFFPKLNGLDFSVSNVSSILFIYYYYYMIFLGSFSFI